MAENVIQRAQRLEKFSQSQAIDEMGKCMEDPVYFIRNYGTILNAKTRQFENFDLWPDQVEYVRALHTYDRIVDVKAKQLGITWILVNDAYWDIWHPNHQNVQIGVVAFNELAAKAFIRRLKIVHDKLPRWMRPDDVLTRSMSEIVLAEKVKIDGIVDEVRGRMNWIRAFASTENFLRGESPSRAFFDEADFIPDLADMLPTVIGSMAESDGQLVFNSTPRRNGLGDFFHEMYWGAGVKGSPFERYKKFFFSWKISPHRDEEWARIKKQELGDRFRIEFPATDVEAWAATGACFFGAELLTERIQAKIDHPAPPQVGELIYHESPEPDQPPFEFVPRDGGWLRLFKPPHPDHLYCIGGDPSGGGKDGDDAVAQVLDDDTLEAVALIVGKILPDDFAYMIHKLALWYNNAFVGVEANTGGEVNRILVDPEECAYYNVYLRQEMDTLAATIGNKIGFMMSYANKKHIYDELEVKWRTGRLTIYDIDTLYEMQNVTWLAANRVGTTGKQPDNRPDALAIALEMHRVRPSKSKEPATDFALQLQYKETVAKIEAYRRQGIMAYASNFLYDGSDPSESQLIS